MRTATGSATLSTTTADLRSFSGMMIDEPCISCAASLVYEENEHFSSDSKVGAVPKNDRQGPPQAHTSPFEINKVITPSIPPFLNHGCPPALVFSKTQR